MVPADKMEEFLSELKTVKLRRVGSGNSLSQSTANSSSGLEHSQTSSQGSSFLEDRSVVGYKRKRVDSGKEAQSVLGKSVRHQSPTRFSTVVLYSYIHETPFHGLISNTYCIHLCSVDFFDTFISSTTSTFHPASPPQFHNARCTPRGRWYYTVTL